MQRTYQSNTQNLYPNNNYQNQYQSNTQNLYPNNGPNQYQNANYNRTTTKKRTHGLSKKI